MTDLALRFVNACIWILVRILYRFPRTHEPPRIMVLRSSRLGDFICAMPALNRLRKEYPSAKILLLTLPSASKLMRGKEGSVEWLDLLSPGVVDEVILFHGEDIYSLRALSELRRRVKAFAPDLMFIFPFAQETAWSRIKKIIFLRSLGARYNLFGWRATSGRSISRRQHQIWGPLNALVEQGVRIDVETDISFNIAVDQNAKTRVDAIWQQSSFIGMHVVAIFPGGTFDHKRWPLEKFRVLCQTLLRNYPVAIVVVGGKGEESLGKALSSIDPGKVHDWVGCTSLMETAEILRRSSLFIGNDSGAAHLASAVGTPTVTIFSGIEPPGTWEPWRSRDLAVRIPVECQPCLSHTFCPNGTLSCTRWIEVKHVLDVCEPILLKWCGDNRELCLKSL